MIIIYCYCYRVLKQSYSIQSELYQSLSCFKIKILATRCSNFGVLLALKFSIDFTAALRSFVTLFAKDMQYNIISWNRSEVRSQTSVIDINSLVVSARIAFKSVALNFNLMRSSKLCQCPFNKFHKAESMRYATYGIITIVTATM